MSQAYHPTAIIGAKAVIGEGTRIGAYSVIDDGAVIGKNCEIHEHVIIRNLVTLGDQVSVFPFTVVGGAPQHLGYKNEPTMVMVGDRVTLRESVTVHRGTAFGTGITSIGEDSYIMAYSHVAHDCSVGKGVILANSVQLGGHVKIGDFVTIGGQSGVAQFCRVGMYCYLGGSSVIRKDLPPFLVGKGTDFEVQGINIVGLQRRGFNADTIQRLKNVFKIFFLQKNTVEAACAKIREEIGDSDDVRAFLDFVNSSKLGFVR